MSLYAGFDCSTQRMSVVVIDTDRREVVFRDSLAFTEPFLPPPEPGVVHAVPTMWVEAVSVMLDRTNRNIERPALRAISGSAQQHGSVYCGSTPEVLTRPTSPIWMDSSTARECAEIEEALGGPAAVAQLSGSRAYPRFTGPQIRKFARQEPSAYAATRCIHVVSSYLASILIGEHAPIDHADASGMTLMDLRRRTWSTEALEATAAHLSAKLPPLVPSATQIGRLAERWQRRFGFPAAAIVAWSGDNPSSLIGTGLIDEGQLAISLGTSDTIFGPMHTPRVSGTGIGHVFASPLGEYMGITVFRNGSLARERVRGELGLSWEGFSEALRATPAGNRGAMMLPWFEAEITPEVPLPEVCRSGLDDAPRAAHVRAIVEGQALALVRHSQWMDVAPRAIYATGGAAANREILQVIADVFDCTVHRFDSTDSAALGAALRAFQAHTGRGWADIIRGFTEPLPQEAVTPVPEHVDMYRQLRPRYAALEARTLAMIR